METTNHPMSELFAQLGLANDSASIEAFIRDHAPLAADVCLNEAPFWTPAQAALLREERAEDADWTEIVEQLDAALRHG